MATRFKVLPRVNKACFSQQQDLDVPFPDPYILSVHFSHDVIECVNTVKMSMCFSGVAFHFLRKPDQCIMCNRITLCMLGIATDFDLFPSIIFI